MGKMKGKASGKDIGKDINNHLGCLVRVRIIFILILQ
jgi:hypothetical protein